MVAFIILYLYPCLVEVLAWIIPSCSGRLGPVEWIEQFLKFLLPYWFCQWIFIRNLLPGRHQPLALRSFRTSLWIWLIAAGRSFRPVNQPCEFYSLQLAAVSDHFRPVSQPCEFQPGEFYSLQLAAVSDQSTNSGRPSSFILPSSHGWGHAGEKEAQAAGAATGLLKVFGKILICYDRFVTCCFREPGANIMES